MLATFTDPIIYDVRRDLVSFPKLPVHWLFVVFVTPFCFAWFSYRGGVNGSKSRDTISVCMKTYTFHTANTQVVYFWAVRSERKNVQGESTPQYNNMLQEHEPAEARLRPAGDKMLRLSTLSFHAANAGDRLLERFLPPVWLGMFTTISHGTPFHSCCNMPMCRLGFSYGPRMMALRHIFFSLFGHSRRTCSRNTCSTRWTNSMACFSGVPWEGRGLECSTPPPEIPKALQNRAKLNPTVKTVKNCWI